MQTEKTPLNSPIQFPRPIVAQKEIVEDLNERTYKARLQFPPPPTNLNNEVIVTSLEQVKAIFDGGSPVAVVKGFGKATSSDVFSEMENATWMVNVKDQHHSQNIVLNGVPTTYIDGSEGGLNSFGIIDEEFRSPPNENMTFRYGANFYDDIKNSGPHIVANHYTPPHIDPIGTGAYIMMTNDTEGHKVWRCANVTPLICDQLFTNTTKFDWKKVEHKVVALEKSDLLIMNAMVVHEVWSFGIVVAKCGYFFLPSQINLKRMIVYSFIQGNMIHQGSNSVTRQYQSFGIDMWFDIFWKAIKQKFFDGDDIVTGIPTTLIEHRPWASSKTLMFIYELCYDNLQQAGYSHEEERSGKFAWATEIKPNMFDKKRQMVCSICPRSPNIPHPRKPHFITMCKKCHSCYSLD